MIAIGSVQSPNKILNLDQWNVHGHRHKKIHGHTIFILLQTCKRNCRLKICIFSIARFKGSHKKVYCLCCSFRHFPVFTINHVHSKSYFSTGMADGIWSLIPMCACTVLGKCNEVGHASDQEDDAQHLRTWTEVAVRWIYEAPWKSLASH